MRSATDQEKKARETLAQLISDYRTGLEAITLTKDDIDLDPVMVDGMTNQGYQCNVLVDPRVVAPILLKYDYPVFAGLNEAPLQVMWDELALELGLDEVTFVDL